MGLYRLAGTVCSNGKGVKNRDGLAATGEPNGYFTAISGMERQAP